MNKDIHSVPAVCKIRRSVHNPIKHGGVLLARHILLCSLLPLHFILIYFVPASATTSEGFYMFLEFLDSSSSVLESHPPAGHLTPRSVTYSSRETLV